MWKNIVAKREKFIGGKLIKTSIMPGIKTLKTEIIDIELIEENKNTFLKIKGRDFPVTVNTENYTLADVNKKGIVLRGSIEGDIQIELNDENTTKKLTIFQKLKNFIFKHRSSLIC